MSYDNMSIKEIRAAISKGLTTEKDVVEYYNNEWWDEHDQDNCKCTWCMAHTNDLRKA